MIPKIIHYCWFGRNPKPPLIQNCIKSWEKYCPDYEILEWNEDNFDVDACKYSQEAYAAKKWAYVADYARLCVLYRYGGIYLDTDMELLKPIDEFLDNKGFLSFESKDYVCLGIVGAKPNHSFIKTLKDDYENTGLNNSDSLETMTNVRRMRKTLLDGGLVNNGKQQEVCDMTIYPQKYFFPYSIGLLFNHKPKNAYSIHYVTGSWGSGIDFHGGKLRYIKLVAVNRLRSLIGTDTIDRIKIRLKK